MDSCHSVTGFLHMSPNSCLYNSHLFLPGTHCCQNGCPDILALRTLHNFPPHRYCHLSRHGLFLQALQDFPALRLLFLHSRFRHHQNNHCNTALLLLFLLSKFHEAVHLIPSYTLYGSFGCTSLEHLCNLPCVVLPFDFI